MERNPGDRPPSSEQGEGLHINSIVIPADDEQPLHQSLLLAGGLADRQQLVGGYIQAVNLGEPPALLYFNEDGKQIGLAPNKRATLLLWVHNPAFRHMDFIVGDAFVVGPVGRQSTDKGAPDEYVQTLFEATRFYVEVRPYGDPEWHEHPERFDDWIQAYEHAVGWGAGIGSGQQPHRAAVRVVPEA
jgi:Domain of unknown function (DUF3846)